MISLGFFDTLQLPPKTPRKRGLQAGLLALSSALLAPQNPLTRGGKFATKIENDERIEDPPPPLELGATFLAGRPTFSATVTLGPLPTPPWYRRFMDLNVKLLKLLLKEGGVVAARGAIWEGVKWLAGGLLFGRNRQPAQVSSPGPIFLPLHRVSPTQIPETGK